MKNMTRQLYILLILVLSMTITSQGQITVTGPTKINSGASATYTATSTCSTKSGICWTAGGTIGSDVVSNNVSVGEKSFTPDILPGGNCTGANTVSVTFPTVSTLTTTSVRGENNCSFLSTLTVVIVPPLSAVSVSPATQSVTCGTTPGLLTASSPSGGDGTYAYTWQASNDNSTWTTISGATAATYQPAVNSYPYYRVVVISFDYTSISATATVTVTQPPFAAGVISNPNQTVVANMTPAPINCSPATGGTCSSSPVYTSVWKASTDGVEWFSVIATTQNFSPGPLTQTTMFLRADTYTINTGTGQEVEIMNSNVATITVVPPLTGGTIAAPANGANLYGTAYLSNTQSPSGGPCTTNAYSWWQSIDGINFTQIPGAANLDLTTPVLDTATYFKREATCGVFIASSNIVLVTLHPALAPGTVTPSTLTIPSGTSPGLLTASGATGGACGGNYTYDWQWSEDQVDWHDAGVSTLDYNPGNLTLTTWFRRMVTCGPDQLYTNLSVVTVGTPDTTTPSYLRTREILEPGVTTLPAAAAVTSPFDVHQSTQYFDGAGRPAQTVSMQASPLQDDMVSVNEYDALWRESTRYLPYTSATNNGNYKVNPLTEQQSYNSNLYPGEQAYYGQIDRETSPLGRVTATYSPGASWVGSGRAVTTQYLANAAAEGVIIWSIATAQGSIPTNAGTYGEGMLQELISTDENGMQTILYKDFNGQVILKKVQIVPSPGISHTGWKCTYYVYDDMHFLRFEITSQALVQYLAGTPLASVANALCYRFEYDGMGRVIIQKNPNAAEKWTVYDGAGRAVLLQDGHQRLTNQWIYHKYDRWNRLIVSGLYTDNTHTTQAAMQAYLTSQNLGLYETYTPSAYPVYTLNNSFPVVTDTTTVISYSFYDDYAWTTWFGSQFAAKDNSYDNLFGSTASSAYPFARPLTQCSQTQSMATGQWFRVGSTSQGTLTASYFDDHNRIIQQQELNVSGGTDVSTIQYGFSGRPLQTITRHQKGGVNPQTHTIKDSLSYDHEGRLLSTYRSVTSVINGQPALTRAMQVVSAETYNESGQLATRTLGNSIETQAFDYTVRGWLKGLNRKYVNGAATGNFFGYDLGYDNSTGVAGATYTTPNYTGNTAGTIWMSAGDGVARKYDFSYDDLQQLTGAAFTQNSGGSGGSWSSATLDFSVSGISYDANGNLLSMSEKGWKKGVVATIDQLSYTYPGNATGDSSNLLQNVIDGANDPNSTLGDFHYSSTSKTASTVDYTYDAAGNMVTDNNRSLTITYNYLNLPLHIAIGTKGTIDYTYDAGGAKLKKVVTDNSVAGKTVTTTTTYIGAFEYASRTIVPADPHNPNYTDVPQRMIKEEGRLRFLADTNFNVIGMAGDYFLYDNLNNVRMVLTDQQQVDIYPAATLEGTGAPTDPVAVEENYYSITPSQIVSNSSATGITAYENNNGDPPANNNPNCSNTSVIKQTDLSQKLYRINVANTPKTGLGVTLRVMSGDRLDIFAKSYYTQLNTSGAPANISMAVADIVSGLLGAPNSVAAEQISASQMESNVTGVVTPLNSFIGAHDNASASTTPQAYINYVFFDDQFNYAGSGISQVGSPNVVKSHSADASMQDIIAPKNGYVYIFCSNESPVDVFFDNLQVIHTHGKILEENHYYPFGLTMAAISSQSYNDPVNRYKYQDKELNNMELADSSGVEAYDFGARDYDQQIGRWHNPDPAGQFSSPYVGMGNNWPNGVDPDGKYFGLDDLIAGVVGGIVNLGSQWLSGNLHSFGQGLGYFGTGFAGGVVFEYGGPVASGAIIGIGNGLVQGKSFGDVMEEGALGAITGAAGGILGGAISPALSAATSGLGSTLSSAITEVGTGALSSGLVSGGMNAINGQSFWSGFGQGAAIGAFGGAVSAGAQMAVNAISSAGNTSQTNPASGASNDEEPNAPPADPEELRTAPASDDLAMPNPGTNAQPIVRQPEWALPPSPMGFAMEEVTMDTYYPGMTRTPQAATIDGYEGSATIKTQAVQVKATQNSLFNVTRAILKLSDYSNPNGEPMEKILHIVTPPDVEITTMPRIVELCQTYHITLVVTTH